MIKAVFFDAAGILYTRSGPTETYALALLKEKGFSVEISGELKDELMNIRALANQGKIGHDVYWEKFLEARNVTDPDQRREMQKQIVDYSNNVQPMDGASEALSQLKQKGLRLGIITDTMYPVEWKMRRLEKVGVAHFIDIVACSTDLGAHKPDPVVYTYAINQAGLRPEETAFVGHLGSELSGAHQAGMVTIAFNNDTRVKADHFCTSLGELPGLPIF